jgi:hypothetical protein
MADFFGSIDNPLKKVNPNGYGGLADDNGPLTLLGNIFQLIALVAGLYALLNMLLAGMRYISSNGDKAATETARKQMYNSLIGIIIVVLSFTIAAILGQVLFGSADYLFKPKIYGPGTI